ncbi:hypothetical protein V8V91_08475 [Algoriphagus halophilus]|uniref:hypothetical protein n=1 Tax=Algoriphagus halophilus TaxID=226505 RepID=UPI00358E74AB
MKQYTVYFEIFNKKLKANVMAKSEEDAKQKIREKISFHKVEENQDEDWKNIEEMMKAMADVLGVKMK